VVISQRIGVVLAAASLFWVGVFAPVASAGTLVSNLGEPTRFTTTVDMGLWAAQGFATDANSYTLTDFRTVVGNGTGSPSVVAELRASTMSGSIDTSAGGLLTTFTAPDVSGALGVQTFTPEQSVDLDPNTTYYLILGVSGAGSFS
jgi:hypothetical protein